MTCLRSFRMLSLCWILGLGASACASKAEQQALDGLDAFKKCDMRTARERFSSAYDLDARPDFALAFALSDLVVLVEDPAVRRLLPRLGFTGELKADFIYRQDGLLERLSRRTETCQSLEDFVRANIPHPSMEEGGPNIEDVMDETLEFHDLEVAALELSPRLERLVIALERAADGMGESFLLEGGCGVGSTRVQRPELYVLAAWLQAFRGAALAWAGYDSHIPIRLSVQDDRLDDREVVFANLLNDHLLRVVDASKLTEARPLLQHALSLGRKATGAVRSSTAAPDGAMFDWSQFPRVILDDMELYLQSAEQGLQRGGLVEVPLLSPSLSIDLDSFLSRPFSTAELSEPAFYTFRHENAWDPSRALSVDSRRELRRVLGQRFSPNPWATEADAQFEFMHEDQWEVSEDTWESVFNPRGRWEQAFDCRR